jgi:GNAT superfamily N-acetyltransferase
MDARAALALQMPGHRAFYRLFDGASPGARVTERDDGLLVCVCPARPERSLVNAVLYEDGAALAAALPELAEAFAAAGAQAWTVWVQPGDDAVAEACAAHGHVLDATPELMWAPLADVLGDGPAAGVALDEAPPWTTIGAVNDAAFGLPPGHLTLVMAGASPDPAAAPRAVAVGPEGEPLACAAVAVAGDVAEVVMVATLPAARGRGLAAACIRSCLARARAGHGARWTTLEATKMGEPLYAHMGYRRAGAYGMWERRTAGT